MRRKILMGVLALALPIGTVVGLSSAATAGKPKPPPDPARSCTAHGTVHFQAPGLSKTGSVSPTLKVSDTTTSGVGFGGGCTGSVPNLVIASKNTKCKGPNDPAGTACEAKKTFAYDGESTFASGSTITSLEKSLKKLDFTIDGVTYQTKTTGASAISCTDATSPPGGQPVEAGFNIKGTVKSPKQDKGETTSLNACLGTDGGPGTSGSFFDDLGSGVGVITTASIDGVSSTVSVS
jgi:hypothetical protein